MTTIDLARTPHAGFGDEPNTSIKFVVLTNRDGRDPAWSSGEATINTFQPRHTSNIVTQVPNERAPRELTARLRFARAADMEALDAVQGGLATLRIPWGVTTGAGGTKQVIAGCEYLVLPATLLVVVTDQQRYRNGTAIATATFRRSVADVSVAGFAIAQETGE